MKRRDFIKSISAGLAVSLMPGFEAKAAGQNISEQAGSSGTSKMNVPVSYTHLTLPTSDLV